MLCALSGLSCFKTGLCLRACGLCSGLHALLISRSEVRCDLVVPRWTGLLQAFIDCRGNLSRILTLECALQLLHQTLLAILTLTRLLDMLAVEIHHGFPGRIQAFLGLDVGRVVLRNTFLSQVL